MRVDDFLAGNTPATENETKVIWNYTILDASGSMDSRTNSRNEHGHWIQGPTKFEAAIKGIEAEIASMKEDKTGVKFKVAIVEFEGDFRYSGYYRYVVKPCDISKVDYKPGRPAGGTPLLATIGEVITDIRKIKPKGEPCIVSVFTDGGENSSTGSPWAVPGALRKLMDEATDDLISVKFLGTDRDVENMINNYGISRGNTFSYENSAQGITRGFEAKISATTAYSKSYAGGASAQSLTSMNFFSDPNASANNSIGVPEKKDKEENKKKTKK
jgi:hypothetical protein